MPYATAEHVCFGNNVSRPFVARGFDRLFPGLNDQQCDVLLLEFANREMSGLARERFA
jgi:hypothetical protein